MFGKSATLSLITPYLLLNSDISVFKMVLLTLVTIWSLRLGGYLGWRLLEKKCQWDVEPNRTAIGNYSDRVGVTNKSLLDSLGSKYPYSMFATKWDFEKMRISGQKLKKLSNDGAG